jgi:hypothetical protein
MAIPIRSTEDFNIIIGLAVSKAIHEVIDKMFNELEKTIEKNVYGAGTGMGSHSLIEGWRKEAHGLDGLIEFEPAWLPLAPSKWIHGSAYDNAWRDVRDIILDIIQGGYRAYNAHTGIEISDSPFWNEFIAKVDARFDKWAKAALRRQGLKVV